MYTPLPTYEINTWKKIQMLRHQVRLYWYWWMRQKAKTPFFILCEARTGSGLLSDYLQSVPNISVGGEVLNPLTTPGIRKNASKKRALNHIKYSLNALPNECCGVKLHLKHCQWHNINVEDLQQTFPGAKYIILYRKNIAQEFISEKIAAKTLQYESRNSAQKQSFRGKIWINRQEFEAYCEWLLGHYRYILSQPNLEDIAVLFSYEELTSAPRKVLDQQVFPLLGIGHYPVTTSLKKQNSRTIDDLIENYQEMADLLSKYMNVGMAFQQPIRYE